MSDSKFLCLPGHLGAVPTWLVVLLGSVVVILAIVLPASLVPRPVDCGAIKYDRPGSFIPPGLCFNMPGVNNSVSGSNNISVTHIGSGQLYISTGGGNMKVFHGFPVGFTQWSQTQQSGVYMVNVALNTSNPQQCQSLNVYRNPAWNCNTTQWNLPYPQLYFNGNSIPLHEVPWMLRNPSNCDADSYSINGTFAVADWNLLNFALQSAFPNVMCPMQSPAPVEVYGAGFLSPGMTLQYSSSGTGGMYVSLPDTQVLQCSTPSYLISNHSIELCSAAVATVPTLPPVTGVQGSSIWLQAQQGFPCQGGVSPNTLRVAVIDPLLNVTAITPQQGCSNTAGSFTNISGTQFLVMQHPMTGTWYYPTVTFGILVSPSTRAAHNCTPVNTLSYLCSVLEVEIPLSTHIGSVSVTVTQPLSCQNTTITMVNAFTYVVSDVFVIYADPPILPSLITYQVTVYTSGLTQPTPGVWLLDPTTNARYLHLNYTVTGTSYNKFLVSIPANLPAASYGLEVEGMLCSGFLARAVTITSTFQPDITSITPSYVWTQRDTGVRVTVPSGLLNPPTMFLSLSGGSNSAKVLGLQYESSTSLTAVIPALSNALPAGWYDVFVLNPPPQNQVYKLLRGLRIQNNDPIQVASITPEFFLTNAVGTATVLGRNFIAPVSATQSCIAQSGNGFVDIAITPSSLPVTFVDNATLTLTIPTPTSTVPSYYFCNLNLVNGDGATATLSGFTAGSSSYNPTAWVESAATFNTARYGHSLAGSKTSSSSRIVYAVGGLSATSTPLSSVEYSTADATGTLNGWTTDRQPFPVNVSYACAAALDQFVYVTGGNANSAAATSNVYRAQILSPLAVPTVTNVDFSVDITKSQNTSFAPGFYAYQVSAVFDATYKRNPSGETLPSDTVTVNVPDIGFAIGITLSWNAVPNAVAYRIYRTPSANANPSQIQFLANVLSGVTSYKDTDTVATSPSVTPKRPGELGQWHTVSSMSTPRTRLGCTFAPLPSNSTSPSATVSTTRFFLYAAAGLNDAVATPSALASMEFLTVDIVAPTSTTDSSDQIVASSWTTTASPLGTARFNLNMISGTRAEFATVNSGAVRICFGGGCLKPTSLDSCSGSSGYVDSETFTLSGTSGDISGAVTVAGNGFTWGYCIAKGGNRFRIAGGGTTQSQSCTSTLSAPVASDGTYQSNNDPTAPLVQCRRYSSCQRVGGFIFNCAGFDGTNVWNTCEVNFF